MISNLTVGSFGQHHISIAWDEGDYHFHFFADPTSLMLRDTVLFKRSMKSDDSPRRLDATTRANAASIATIKTLVRNNRLVETYFEEQRTAQQQAQQKAAEATVLSKQCAAGPALYTALSSLLKVARMHLPDQDPHVVTAESALKYAETGETTR